MSFYPIFLSVVVVVKDEDMTIGTILKRVEESVAPSVSDYELIVVDNASTDDTVSRLKELSGENGMANVQVYALTKEVDLDTATWVGLESALGDYVAVFDPSIDDIGFLNSMIEKAVSGVDVVFAKNEKKPKQSAAYSVANGIFNILFKSFSGVHLAKEAPQYRVLSKTVINFILQHPLPPTTYRHLPASGGFVKSNLSYSAPAGIARKKRLREAVDRGMRLLVSTTKAPMRIVTSLSLFGAFANLIYSVYVLAVGLFKADVSPGWTSLSLQQSGMFFLISLVLLILGEYIMHMASVSSGGPLYHVAQEFTSARMTRREKLNIEESTSKNSVK